MASVTRGNFLVWLRTVLQNNLCPRGYKRYIISNGSPFFSKKDICALMIVDLHDEPMPGFNRNRNLFDLKNPYTVTTLNQYKNPHHLVTVKSMCGGLLIHEESRLEYYMGDGCGVFCKAKEKWYIDVSDEQTVSFFDHFGAFTKANKKTKGYIMDYINPKFVKGTGIIENDKSSSFLLKVMPENRCPKVCKLLYDICYCNTLILHVKKPKNSKLTLKEICRKFGTVLRYNNNKNFCKMETMRRWFLNERLLFRQNVKVTNTKPNNGQKYIAYRNHYLIFKHSKKKN
jgi:hypothetical protein